MTESELAALVRRVDPDRFIGVVFAPPPVRRWLLVLYAFNHELARAREVASTPPLVLIRLHWWREVVEGAGHDHPVAHELAAGLAQDVFDPADLGGLVDAREAEAEPIADRAAFLAYARGTAGALMRIGGGILGATDRAELAALEDVGTGYAIAAILRTTPSLRAVGRHLLPQDGTTQADLIEEATMLLNRRTPSAARAASLPAVLGRRDLARMRDHRPPSPRGLADRLAVIMAGFARRP